MRTKKTIFSIYLEDDLVSIIEAMAYKQKQSRNQLIAALLKTQLAQLKAEKS